MANHCTHIASRGVTDPEALPEGVRISLHQFLAEALTAFENGVVHSDALTVARNALADALHPPPRNPADVRKYLQRLADIVAVCTTLHKLTDRERGYARKAIAFFQAIVRAGDDADIHHAFKDDELDEHEFA